MKPLVTFTATLTVAILNARCTKSSTSSAPQSEGTTVATLTSSTVILKGLETPFQGALGKVFANADTNKDQRFKCAENNGSRGRACTLKATASDDSMMCVYRLLPAPEKIYVYCEITVSNWPQVAPEIANVIAPEFIRLGFAEGSPFTSKGNHESMTCEGADRAWLCKFADFTQIKKIASVPKKQNVTVPEGLKDEFGSILPSRSKDYMLNLPTGSIKVSTYRASEQVLAEFKKVIADVQNLEIDDEGDAPKCKDAEKLALVYYTSEGYKAINSGLRKLAQGQKPDRKTELGILAAISALNCAEPGKEEFVVRGATLSLEKLAKYQKDAIVVEHAFTSTSIDNEVLDDFKGNTEFRIIEARGANLAEFGTWSENGERELLIAPGTLFKVIDRRLEGKTTLIELQQLP